MSPDLPIVKKDFFSSKEAILAEVERDFQKATIQSIEYVDQESGETKSQLEVPEADDSTVDEESSEARDRSANVKTDQNECKKNAVKKMDQSLKLLKSLDDTFSRDESTKYVEGTTMYNAPADGNHELKQSTSNFPSTMKSAASEPSKYQHSNTGSRSSLTVERNLWSKSREWLLRKGKGNTS